MVFRLQIAPPPQAQPSIDMRRLQAVHEEARAMGYSGNPEEARTAGKKQPVKVEEKIGRNDPCPCGSGKKYKKCHGAVGVGS